jgi:hypothetical protein
VAAVPCLFAPMPQVFTEQEQVQFNTAIAEVGERLYCQHAAAAATASLSPPAPPPPAPRAQRACGTSIRQSEDTRARPRAL